APPERLSKAGQKPESKQNKTDKKTKNIKLKFPQSTVGCKQSGNKTPSNESLSSEHKDGKPTDRPEEDHDCIDDIYGETASQNSHSEDNNYTELDTRYTPVPQLYEKYITEAPKAKETTSLPSTPQTIKPPPPLSIKPPPQTQEDKQAISRFPQNLSGAPPERLSKAGQKPESKQNKTDKKTKNIKMKFPYRTVGCKQSGNKTPSNESLSSEHKDGKPTDRPEEDHDCIDDMYEEIGSQNSHSEDNYTELDTTYTPVPRLYEKYITEAPKAKETIKPPPPLSIKPPPQIQEDKQAISRFPQNLSGTPPERLSKAGQKPQSKQNKTDKKTKNIKMKFPYRTVGCKQSGKKTPSNESLSSGHKYEKRTDRPEEDHDCIDDMYEETASQNSHSEDNYTELDTTYTPVPRLYEKYITEAPKAKETISLPSTPQTTKPPPPLPIKPPPQTQEDKQAISRFPQNLSGLSVADISRLLGHLNLGDYVQTFAN
ncbi:Hypothetical predicted protein, partial [Paramuricea clavata]